MKDLEEVFITIMSLFIIIVIVTSVITLGLMGLPEEAGAAIL